MKLSFVMCSNRKGLEAISRVARLAALASADIEVVVRDNSGDPEKRDFLSRMQDPNRKIVSVDPCPSWENMLNALSLATGDYVFEVHDDDDLNVIAIPALLRCIEETDGDFSFVSVTGFYVLETFQKSIVYAFKRFDEPSPVDRVAAFLNGSPSVLHFSAIRRNIRSRLDEFNSSLPFRFSYLDQIQSVLLLCSGRVRTVDRIIYSYDMHNWADAEQGREADLKFYKDAGVDGSALRLHGLLMAFEGTKAVASKYFPLGLTPAQRIDIAHKWFSAQFGRFVNSRSREDGGARFDAQALAMEKKWKAVRDVNFDELLVDLSEFFALSSPEAGQRYYDFWR